MRIHRSALVVLSAAVCLSWAAESAPPDQRALQARQMYREGKLAEALPLFEEAIARGASGAVYYEAAFCVRGVRGDQEKAREYMTRALPLLEGELAASKTPAPYYYASAIYANELNDRDRAVEVARLGIERRDSGTFDLKTGESHFQLARLLTILGRTDEALPVYQKAADLLEKEPAPPVEIRRQTVEQLARTYMAKGDTGTAARWYARRVSLGGIGERERFQAAMVMVQGGLYPEALAALEQFDDDALMVEANYIGRVLGRSVELGMESRPDWAAMDDQTLLTEALKAAATLSEFRQQEEEKAKASPVERPYEWKTNKKGVRFKHYLPHPAGWAPKDPDNPTPQEQAILRGETVYVAPAASELSPARLSAERDFYGILLEYVRRGRLLREVSLQQGFASLIFR